MHISATIAPSNLRPQLQPRPKKQLQHIIIRQPLTKEEYYQMYALRYNVYTASGITVAPSMYGGVKIDRDNYDPLSDHWVAFMGDQMIGTLRAISFSPKHPFLTERLFKVKWPRGVRPEDCVEASRAAVLPAYRTKGVVFQALLVAQYFWLRQKGIKWWIASLKEELRSHLREHCGLELQELSGKKQPHCDLYPDYMLNKGVGAIILEVEKAEPLFLSLKKHLPEGVDFL